MMLEPKKKWKLLLSHLGGEDSTEEKEVFSKWLNQSKENELLFLKVKTLWNESSSNESFYPNTSQTFFGRFTKQKIKNFILNQAIGNLIGFVIGMWVTSMFSHYVLEKRGLKNLFGLAGRKKIAVNEIPEWLQSGIAILLGFIALELINHFFQTKKYLMVWEYIKSSFINMKNANKDKTN